LFLIDAPQPGAGDYRDMKIGDMSNKWMTQGKSEAGGQSSMQTIQHTGIDEYKSPMGSGQ